MQYESGPILIAWLALAGVVLALALYRKIVSRTEDDLIHMHQADAVLISRQMAFARRLELIDFWGKTLTILAAVFGLALLALLVYQKWVESLQPMP